MYITSLLVSWLKVIILGDSVRYCVVDEREDILYKYFSIIHFSLAMTLFLVSLLKVIILGDSVRFCVVDEREEYFTNTSL